MKPLGMDKNRVLVYEGDIVFCDENKYKAYASELTGELLLMPYIEELNDGGTIGWAFTVPGAVEVVNVSDRTNYERYFADLCRKDDMFKYFCATFEFCQDCPANDYFCDFGNPMLTWLEESAVKL